MEKIGLQPRNCNSKYPIGHEVTGLKHGNCSSAFISIMYPDVSVKKSTEKNSHKIKSLLLDIFDMQLVKLLLKQ